MEFARAIVNGDPTALNLAKTLLSNPTIISLSPPWAISLEANIRKRGTSEVAQHPVIVPGTGRRQLLNDNVAPSPIEWQMEGYIPGNPLIERRCIFTPIVRLNADFLWLAWQRGSRIIFKDTDQRIYTDCVISSLETAPNAECQNKLPFSMTLQELVKLDISKAEDDETEATGTPEGEESDLGTTATSGGGGVTSSLVKFARNLGLIS